MTDKPSHMKKEDRLSLIENWQQIRHANSMIRDGAARFNLSDSAMYAIENMVIEVKEALNSIVISHEDENDNSTFPIADEWLDVIDFISITVRKDNKMFFELVVPEWFFRPKSMSKHMPKYRNVETKRLYLREEKFWEILLDRLTSTNYDQSFLRHAFSLQSECRLLLDIYSSNPLDVDNYDVKGLVNAMVRSGVLHSDSSRHLSGIGCFAHDENDKYRNVAVITLVKK